MPDVTIDYVSHFAAQLTAALLHGGGTHALEDVRRGVETGEYQLWPGETSVIVTQLQVFPRKKLLCIFLAGGKLDELRGMLPPVLAWGKAQGCEGVFHVGRVGWVRTFLIEDGWKPTAVEMVKPL